MFCCHFHAQTYPHQKTGHLSNGAHPTAEQCWLALAMLSFFDWKHKGFCFLAWFLIPHFKSIHLTFRLRIFFWKNEAFNSLILDFKVENFKLLKSYKQFFSNSEHQFTFSCPHLVNLHEKLIFCWILQILITVERWKPITAPLPLYIALTRTVITDALSKF